MVRLLTGLVVGVVLLNAACSTQPHSETLLGQDVRGAEWSIKADYTDSCCCQPSCPCLFGSAPTLDHCEGITLVEIKNGHYRDVRLDGIHPVVLQRVSLYLIVQSDTPPFLAHVKEHAGPFLSQDGQ